MQQVREIVIFLTYLYIMIKTLQLTGALFFCFLCSAQNLHWGVRSAINPSLYPFYHGVASGDPLSDRVIIWTRVTLDNAPAQIQVNWQVFNDSALTTVVASGTTITDSSKDFTVKTDVTGLQPNTWYYYRFSYDTFYSVTGRTRTLPVGAVNNVRFAVASCQDYQSGYYNAHRHIAQRNDIDAVLFLGDYTYEDGADDNPVAERYHEPDKKTTTLVDYRLRQSLYHLDPDLQAAHQQYPWIVVWDDHETANNSYTDSAKNHNSNDGLWAARKANAVKAYNEWMPVRLPDSTDVYRIFRQFTWGNLLDLHMIDTRLYDRDRQAGSIVSVNDSLLNDTTRTMLGPVQFSWLENNLKNSGCTWQLIGQQVMMAPLVIPPGAFGPEPYIVNGDQWDGYPFERQRLYDFIRNDSIRNVVILTGDIHTAWANDLPLQGYDTANRQQSVAVEFVTPSITSGNELPPLVSASVVYSLADYVRYVDLDQHGYYLLDITPQKVQAEFVYVSTLESKTFTTTSNYQYCVNAGETWLHNCAAPSAAQNIYPPLAPLPADVTSLNNVANELTIINLQPNPFINEIQLLLNLTQADVLHLKLINAQGRQVLETPAHPVPGGVYFMRVETGNLPEGMYWIQLQGKSVAVTKAIVKMK